MPTLCFVGIPDLEVKRLQAIQNFLAGVVFPRSSSPSHSLPLQGQLHWLPVEFRIRLKLVCVTYKTLTTSTPTVKHYFLLSFRQQSAIFGYGPRCSTVMVSRELHVATTEE